MFKNYFNVALRSFLKDRQYSIINMLGLVAGFASVFIILGYIKYQLSYDKHYSNSSRLYRVTQTSDYNGVPAQSLYTIQGLGNVLKQEVPGIEAVTFAEPLNNEFLINNQPVAVSSIAASSNFFTTFNFPLISGNPSTVLAQKRNVVVSKDFENKYFPGGNAVGKQVFSLSRDGNKIAFTITGVMENIPFNTHLQASIIIAVGPRPVNFDKNSSDAIYLLLDRNTTIRQVQKIMPSIYAKYNFPKTTIVNFQLATDIHLHSDIEKEQLSGVNSTYIYMFFFIAVFILVIGCINYINLNTARSLQRIKEIGVRKTLGAKKSQLSLQFIIESTLFFVASLPVALLLAFILWPFFAGMVKIPVPQSYLLNTGFIGALLFITLVAGVLSGAYAAFFVSRLRPAYILSDWRKSFSINMRVRKMLIVLQFAVSVAFIIATVIVNQQLYLLNNMQLGFDRSNIIVLPSRNFKTGTQAFKQQLLKNHNITGATVASWSVGDWYGGMAAMDMPGDSTPVWEVNFIKADLDFFTTMGIKITAGRAFSSNYPQDMLDYDSMAQAMPGNKPLSKAQTQNIQYLRPVIITGPIAKMIHLKQPLVGSVLKYEVLSGTVVGTVDDFIGTSLLQKTRGVVLMASPNQRYGSTYIKIKTQNVAATIEYIHNTWKQFFPQDAFDFSFVDDKLNQQYDAQTRLGRLFNMFAGLAIAIALLGLFSMVALTVQQRRKEIGIRKVLGAGVTDIVSLLSKGYLSLILLGGLIVTPVVWWGMNRWLQNFAYHITVHWVTFVFIIGGCIFLALLSIMAQTVKVAGANPVQSLKK